MNRSASGSPTGPFGFLARPLATVALIAAVLVAAMPTATPSAAQATGSLAAFVPADSLVYFELNLDHDSDQVTLAKELIERANLDALLSPDDQDALDESMAMAEDTFAGDVAFFVSPDIASELDVDKLVGDASTLTDDPTSAASEIPSGWAAVLRPDDPEALYETIVESLESDPMAADWPMDSTPSAVEAPPYETTEYGGFEILAVPADEYGSGQVVALVDDLIVVGTVPDDIEPVIDVVNGETDALDSRNEFTDVRDALSEETLAFGYVNGPAVGQILASSSNADLAEIPDELIASLIAYQGFAVWADDPGFRMDTVAVPAPGTNLPVPDPYDGALSDLIPADAMAFAGGTNLGAIPQLDALAFAFAAEIVGVSPDDLATPVDPDDYADEIFDDAEDVLGFNLKTDVLDQLTGEWAVAGTTDLTTGSAIAISEVDDPAVVADVIEQVTSLMTASGDESFTVSSRTVAGAEVTVIEVDADGMPLTIEFGVVDDKLAVGVNGWLDLLETPPTEPISEDANFEDALGYLPSDITGVSYVDLETVLPLVVDAMSAFSSMSVADADPSCGDYASQAEAQAAYDEDSFENYLLDLDWDGEACEDFFAPATPVADESDVEINVTALAAVTWAEDGRTGSSAIIVIGD